MVEQPTNNTYKNINDLSLIKSFDPAFDIINKNKNSKILLIKVILLFILLITIFRVPYCGSYIDAFIFEYFFGFGKYLLYVYLIVLIFLWIINNEWFHKFCKFRFIIAIMLIIVLTSIILSTISSIIFENTVWIKIYNSDLNESDFILRLFYYHNGFFIPYAINNTLFYAYKGVNNLWFMNTRMTLPETNLSYGFIISGGIIGEFVNALNYWIIIFFSLIIMLTIITPFVKNSNTKFGIWFHKKIIKWFSDNKNDIKEDDFNSIINQKPLKDEKDNFKNKFDINTPPLSFLVDTSDDNNRYNLIDANKTLLAISQIIKSSNLNIKFNTINIMPMFTEIKFFANDYKDVDNFIKKGNAIGRSIGLSQFYISTRENNITFEYQNYKPSKVSIKSTLINNNIGNNMCYAVVGIDENKNPLFVDYKSDSSIFIIGRKGSGINMLLSCMIITSAYISSPTFLNIDVITKNKNSVIQSLSIIPHIGEVISNNSSNDIKKLLDKYVNEIKIRKIQLTNYKVKDQKSFNNMCDKLNMQPMITKVLVINNYDEIIKNNLECISKINYILQHCNKLGICIILTASEIINNNLNNNIIEGIKNIFVLKIDSNELSLKLIGSARACQLYGNGDGYLIGGNKKDKLRFQTCYLNQEELSNIVKTIVDFYKTKRN